jgi:signal transduction histidine kinase
MFANSTRLLFISSLMAWSTACIVDGLLIQGINVVVLCLYVAQLLLWVMALSDAIARQWRLVCSTLGLLLALMLSLMPQVVLAPVMLFLWISLSPFFLSKRHSWGLYIVYNAIFLLATFYLRPDNIITAASFVAFQLFSLSSSFLRIDLTKKSAALETANAKLHRAQLLLAQRSKAQERLRISRDLHDSIGQRLTALSLHCEFALHQSPVNLQEFLRSLKRDISATLEQLQAVVMQFKQQQSFDLATALREIAARIPGLTFELDFNSGFNDTAIDEQLLFCLQEGINNALRHGQATHISIVGTTKDNYLLLSLEDNGERRDNVVSENSGTGLEGMQRRLAPYDTDVDFLLLADKAILTFRIPVRHLSTL